MALSGYISTGIALNSEIMPAAAQQITARTVFSAGITISGDKISRLCQILDDCLEHTKALEYPASPCINEKQPAPPPCHPSELLSSIERALNSQHEQIDTLISRASELRMRVQLI